MAHTSTPVALAFMAGVLYYVSIGGDKMVEQINYQRPEVDSFGVATVDERYVMMNKSFQNGEYGECINYARSMIESALKYVYRMLKGVEIEKDLNKEYITLHQLSTKTLKLLNSELENADTIERIQIDMINIIDTIGNLRNATSVSHGSATRTKSVNEVEARYILFNSESIVLMLLDLLFNKTHSLKINAVGSIIDSNGLKKYSDFSYKDEKRDINYLVLEGTGTISQVSVTFPEWVDIKKDKEFFSDWISEFVEDDVTVEDRSTVGINKFMYYSKKKDFYYEVQIENNILYVTREFH